MELDSNMSCQKERDQLQLLNKQQMQLISIILERLVFSYITLKLKRMLKTFYLLKCKKDLV